MFTTAVDVTNKNDLTPALEELTRSPHGITGTVTRQEVTSCQGASPPLVLYAQGRREALQGLFFLLAKDLPLLPSGWGQGLCRMTRHRPGGRCTLRPGVRGAAHPLPCPLSRRKWGGRDAFVQINHQAGRSGPAGVQPLPSGFKVTNPTHRVLCFPGISVH